MTRIPTMEFLDDSTPDPFMLTITALEVGYALGKGGDLCAELSELRRRLAHKRTHTYEDGFKSALEEVCNGYLSTRGHLEDFAAQSKELADMRPDLAKVMDVLGPRKLAEVSRETGFDMQKVLRTLEELVKLGLAIKEDGLISLTSLGFEYQNIRKVQLVAE